MQATPPCYRDRPPCYGPDRTLLFDNRANRSQAIEYDDIYLQQNHPEQGEKKIPPCYGQLTGQGPQFPSFSNPANTAS